MDYLLNELLSKASAELTFISALLTMLAALLFGGAIAFTYYRTQEETYQSSLALTLFMLPMILSVMILFVGSNITRAFSLAGTLSIIRFRSAPGDAKDIGFIFFDIAAGLACGVGLYGYGAFFVLFLCMTIFLSETGRIFEKKEPVKTLKITVPEDLNVAGAFDDILTEYTKKYRLIRLKTTDLGALFELSYRVVLAEENREQEFLNALRCRNGNLNIQLAETDFGKLK